jgi:hypothetical protein
VASQDRLSRLNQEPITEAGGAGAVLCRFNGLDVLKTTE